jgi:hypothetical protein
MIGRRFSAIRLCCLRPLWTRNGSREPSTKRPTGYMWATPRAFVGPGKGYSATAQSPKMVFVKPLISNAQALLSRPILKPAYRTGGPKIMLSAQHMQSLPDFFADIPDPRRAQGRRHRLSTVLAIAAGATLCGMRGYLAISDWAKSLGQKARKRFRCRYENSATSYRACPSSVMC